MGTRFEPRDLAGIKLLQVFKVVTVVLCHPAWQQGELVRLYHVDIDLTEYLFDYLKHREQAVEAIKLMLGQRKKGGDTPKLTVIATGLYVQSPVTEGSLPGQIARLSVANISS